ncbi:MAG: mechanosensitive ion channel [Phycisphaerae bacterium]|nr:mechanosensitive ion channel [Phycisphaerae bacterium]
MDFQAIMTKLQEFVAAHGPKVLAALATLIIGWIIARILTSVARRFMTRAKVEATLTGFACNLIYMGLLTLVIISAIGKLQVPTASFVAVIGAAGLAIGFALQGSLANFAAGVMLIIFRPFKVGDFVDAGGVSGVVSEIQVFATTIKTPDNKLIVVPNSSLTGGAITNYSAQPTRRVDLVFGIGYGDDIDKAKRTIADVFARDSRVLKDPEPTIAVSELGSSSVNIAARPWVNTGDYWAVYFDTLEAVKKAFDAGGITIPFPQQDVHMHQVA